MYVKLFGTILDSSIWAQPGDTRLVWITMLAMADKDGYVRASPSGLAHRARVSLKACRAALKVLSSPDRESSSPEYGGRRIEAVEGGWQLLNYTKYREIRTEEQLKAAARQRSHRLRRKRDMSRPLRTEAEEEAEGEAEDYA